MFFEYLPRRLTKQTFFLNDLTQIAEAFQINVGMCDNNEWGGVDND